MSFASQPLSQALTPKKSNLPMVLLLLVGLVLCLGAAAYGYVESRRTEQVVIAARDIPYGRQIVADDLAVIELPLHRPVQIAGITNPAAIIGQYAARQIGPNDIVQGAMLMAEPPSDPVYPNGARLGRDMVPVPFALAALGPIADRDFVNIGFTTTDATLCDRELADVVPGTVLPPPVHMAAVTQPGDATAAGGPQTLPRAFACRFMSNVRILYIDGDTAYLEMTPTQAHAMWALNASGVSMWGERYGSHSTPLLYMDRLDAGQITLPDITLPVSETIRIEPALVNPASAETTDAAGAAIPGATTQIPGSDASADESADGTSDTAAP
ncbi:MAG TPA: SAF domain-containing protein [Roseiflexaceae bacterium]|nr:SAF domain-containing protein [Roseiflexaceae bacterium]